MLQNEIDYSKGRADKIHQENRSVTKEYVNEAKENLKAQAQLIALETNFNKLKTS